MHNPVVSSCSQRIKSSDLALSNEVDGGVDRSRFAYGFVPPLLFIGPMNEESGQIHKAEDRHAERGRSAVEVRFRALSSAPCLATQRRG